MFTAATPFDIPALSGPACFLSFDVKIASQEVTVAGNGTYSTVGGFAASADGTWHWTARYSGDQLNNPATSECSAESVNVRISPRDLVLHLTEVIKAFDLAPGSENSLIVKLQAAVAALDPDPPSTCGLLGAFINEVQAVSDKKLALAQASQLIADANEIRGMLACR